MTTGTPYDFGYAWWMTWGHLVPLVLFAALAVAGWARGWRWWTTAIPGLLALWALAGWLIMHQVIAVQRPLPLPTGRFLAGDAASRVLDLGAGSGRATLMVALSRPRATVVALDIYSGYWGIDDNTPERLRRNAEVAGVSSRVSVKIGDMRTLPFEAASFDGVVSSFAIDHLRHGDRRLALAEAARVLRPGGQLLIMNLRPDIWIRLAIPTPPGHGYFSDEQDGARWRTDLTEAGFSLLEQGTRPGTVYFLAERRPSQDVVQP